MSHSARPSWMPLVTCCLGTFLLLTYTTIITVGLPEIGTRLTAGFGAMQRVVDGYPLALAGLLLGMGSLGDSLGRRRVHLLGLAVFSLATLAGGLAGSVGLLIAARIAQGVGGAAMFATILPLIALTYHGRAKATAFAVWGAVAGAAGAVGTVAGGLFTELLSWRWIFLGFLPVCALTLVLAVSSLRESNRQPTGIDLPGILTSSASVTALTYAVINGGDRGWSAPATLFGLGASVLAGLAFVLVERRRTEPIVPPGLFGSRSFVGVLVAAFCYYFASYGELPVLSRWLRDGVRLASLGTSLLLSVQLVLFIAVSGLASGRLAARPASWTLGGATVLIGFGCLTALGVHDCAPWWAVLPALVVTGIGSGVVSPVFPAVAIGSVPPRFGGTAGAAANSCRQLGLTLGIAVSGTVYAGHPADPAAGVQSAYLFSGVLAVLGGALACWLLRPAASAARTTPAAADQPG